LSGSNASVFAGLLTGATFSYDQNSGGTPSSPSFTGTDSVANNGRAGFTGLGSTAATTRLAAAYLTGAGQGFLIGSDTAVTNGLLELQESGPIQINAGGLAVYPFVADEDFTGGSTTITANAIDTSKVTNPAPAAVYQTARTGNFSYTIAGFTPGSSHVVRLHFAETQFAAAGARTFNVSINGTQVLTNFDIFAAAGGQNTANIQQFTENADVNGQYAIQFTSVVSNALVNGIEVEGAGAPQGSASLQGSYTLDTAVPQEKLVTNVIGELYSNGGEFSSPSISGIVDEYDPPIVADPEGLLHLGQSLVSPYTVSVNGRGTLGPISITGFPQNLIVYVVSPGSFRAISADANPGNGHPAVYFFNH